MEYEQISGGRISKEQKEWFDKLKENNEWKHNQALRQVFSAAKESINTSRSLVLETYKRKQLEEENNLLKNKLGIPILDNEDMDVDIPKFIIEDYKNFLIEQKHLPKELVDGIFCCDNEFLEWVKDKEED
jgi:ABC-type oligopeptide transport system ATPase subunit